jgi:ribonuclease BN (tRNA processing enzyme)
VKGKYHPHFRFQGEAHRDRHEAASSSGKQRRASFLNILAFAAPVVLALTIVPGEAIAQSGHVVEAPAGAEILLLGTAAGPVLRKDRSEPSSLLIVNGRQFLIDCGIGTIQRMNQAGIQSETIETIFITHHHPDHDLGLADLMANDYLNLDPGSMHTIDIYGPPQTKELVDAAFSYISIPFRVRAKSSAAAHGMLKSPFVAHEIHGGGLVYQDGTIRVIAAENSHYALMPPPLRKWMKSYSYRFETPHGVIVFTGDTGPSDALIPLAKEADVLVSEAYDTGEVAKDVNELAERNHWPRRRSEALLAHMKAEHLNLDEVGEIASKAGVKSVLLYHYDPTDPAAYVAAVKKHFSGPVFAPADLDRYCLNTQPNTRTSALHLCQAEPAAH